MPFARPRRSFLLGTTNCEKAEEERNRMRMKGVGFCGVA